MKKVKIEKEEKKTKKSTIEHFSMYKGHMMVKISGNFNKDMNLSKKKVQAILDLLPELNKFAAGYYDDQINALEEGEGITPNE